MTPPIRPKVYAMTEFPKEPEQMTMRDALEWFKRCVRDIDMDVARPLEQKYLNERWVVLVDAIASREKVPTGALSYFLGELASAELDLGAVGEAESQAAQMYQ